jgi:hypothetical protein
MTAVEQPNQELFNYLAKQLNVIALQNEMQEIEAIINSKRKQQIKDAYNQGFRDGLINGKFPIMEEFDVSECSNAEDYFNENFKQVK